MKKISYNFKVERDGKSLDAEFKIDDNSLYYKVFNGLASFTSVAVKERDGNRAGHGVRNFNRVKKLQKHLIDNKISKLTEETLNELLVKYEIVTYDY